MTKLVIKKGIHTEAKDKVEAGMQRCKQEFSWLVLYPGAEANLET